MAFNIKVALLGDSSDLDRTFRKASTSARGFNRSMSNTSRVSKTTSSGLRKLGGVAALAGGLVGAAGLASAVKGAYTEMIEAQKVSAQTEAVLKSTGGVAGVTAKQVDSLANSLLAKTGVDDEVIKSGENMLLTFRGIRNEAGRGNDIFDQATKAILDMDTAMTHGNVTQESLSKSAIRVGKALNDPIKGVTALRRVGVQFTKGQQAQIKSLVESGRTMQAQKLILRELNKEFGGSARAMGNTLPGKINIFRESIRNLGAQMAVSLLPALTRVIDRLNKWISNTRNQQRVMNTFKQVVAAVSGVIRIASAVMNRLNHISGSTKNTLKLLVGVLVAYKAIKLTASVADNLALVGRRAKVARVQTVALRRSLLSLAANPIVIPIAFAVAADKAGLNTLAPDLVKTLQGKHGLGDSLIGSPGHRGILGNAIHRATGLGSDDKRDRDRAATAGLEKLRPGEQITVNTRVNLDGKVIARNTTHHQQKHHKRRSKSRRGVSAGH